MIKPAFAAGVPISPKSGIAATIRARAPLRLGLAGGGTDLSPYCDRFGGAVLNATIDRYAIATFAPSPDGRVHFCAEDLENEEVFDPDLDAIAGARLRLHAGVYARMIRQFADGRPIPMRIISHVDAPAGSGLGSSSALGVALVEGFRHLLGLPLGPYDVAHLAYEIERLDLALAGGKQDQYAAAFGGLNFIEFLPGDRVIVNPLRVHRAVINELQSSMVICFTGVSRSSEAIIIQQQRGMEEPSGEALENMHRLKAEAVEMKQALLQGQVDDMARILGRSWAAKKRTAPGVSSDRIEQLHELAMRKGAIGGKVSGAGGGGFMMFIVPPERRLAVLRALNEAGGTASGVDFSTNGAEAWTAPGRN